MTHEYCWVRVSDVGEVKLYTSIEKVKTSLPIGIRQQQVSVDNYLFEHNGKKWTVKLQRIEGSAGL